MTVDELLEELQSVYEGNERDLCGRTVRVAVSGSVGKVDRIEWQFGDLVLVADRAEKGGKEPR